MPFSISTVSSQVDALNRLARVAARGSLRPEIRTVALALVMDCPDRDDQCEIQTIFNAVKNGDSRVPSLSRGLRYTSDPRLADFFTGPAKLLEMCGEGACGGDCDDHAALLAALLGSIGYRTALRAYAGDSSPDFEHVYAVVGYPKSKPTRALGLDTTVSYSYVGWEPPPGRFLSRWTDGGPQL